MNEHLASRPLADRNLSRMIELGCKCGSLMIFHVIGQGSHPKWARIFDSDRVMLKANQLINCLVHPSLYNSQNRIALNLNLR
ncbi:MAG: hypothetical protein CVU44_17330 [Chloroflexi bacterium HGW-Chloroflexi-6]|nr:MAG: hypothetical protein CVU44_17330 [Chloroflexi bacterium HGW-Chloroflexi-6]